MGALQDLPVAHHRRGVVFPDRAAVVARGRVEIDEADDGRDPARGLRDALHGELVRFEEPRVFDEVADAIAGQRHFGRDEEVRSPARGLVEGAEDLCGIAIDVPAGGVHLSERDAHVGST